MYPSTSLIPLRGVPEPFEKPNNPQTQSKGFSGRHGSGVYTKNARVFRALRGGGRHMSCGRNVAGAPLGPARRSRQRRDIAWARQTREAANRDPSTQFGNLAPNSRRRGSAGDAMARSRQLQRSRPGLVLPPTWGINSQGQGNMRSLRSESRVPRIRHHPGRTNYWHLGWPLGA